MSSETSIYKDYIDLTATYQEKYGKQCVLLMMVGAFFEVYGFRNSETQEILIIHYSGKFKPWSVRGAVNYNAEYFQEIYRSIYAKKYYLNVNYKKNAINDILSSISNRSLFSAKHPFSLIWYTIKVLIKL